MQNIDYIHLHLTKAQHLSIFTPSFLQSLRRLAASNTRAWPRRDKHVFICHNGTKATKFIK